MRLNKVQRKFKETMLGSVRNIENDNDEFLSLFDDNHIPVEERLKVYHNNVVGSLAEALRATYPLIEKLVGEDFLNAMAREFIFDNPPASASLYQYGAGFDDFIKTYEPSETLPYLPDIAAFEWAMNNAYYASDDAPLAGDALSNIAPENLGETILNLRASATLLQSRFPILSIRDLCLNDEECEKPDMEKEHNTKLLVIRPALEVNILPIDQDELMMLDMLDRKTPLGDAVEKTLETFPDFDFTSFLQKHIELETFSAFKTNS